MRTVKRPRRYLPRQLKPLLTPLFRYSAARDAYVLRLVGRSTGPVLRFDRRRPRRFEGVERRNSQSVA